ncbi:hypothetical protein [Bradyrhizobium sp. Gha]|uniref:hypothetical protein n=1 Tax=Bradyrhizobium sp. Gha TaxID=1855318 RepID=UPI0015A4F53F|nr:hypothetical protein [Bradyrhizobium sp. Gha]
MIVPIIASMVEAVAGAPLPKLNCPQMPHMVESFGVLDRLVNDKPGRQKTLSHCLVETAWFGDHFTSARDPPPGNTLMQRGLSRLVLGTIIAAGTCRSLKPHRMDTPRSSLIPYHTAGFPNCFFNSSAGVTIGGEVFVGTACR